MCIWQINTPDNQGLTALHRAAQASELQVCRMLINHDADVSLTNNDGQTAAQMASNEVVKKLLEGEIVLHAYTTGSLRDVSIAMLLT